MKLKAYIFGVALLLAPCAAHAAAAVCRDDQCTNCTEGTTTGITNNYGTFTRTTTCTKIGDNSSCACRATNTDVYTSCNTGYTLSSGSCVCNTLCTSASNTNETDTTSCTVANATGAFKTCNGKYTSSGCYSAGATCSGCSSYGSCAASSCNAGYYLASGSCTACPTVAGVTTANNNTSGITSCCTTTGGTDTTGTYGYTGSCCYSS